MIGARSDSTLRARLLRGGVGSIAIKVANIALGFLVSVVLARTLGAEGFGIYSYVFALVTLISLPAQFGLPILVLRETAKALQAADWPTLRGVWIWSNSITGLVSVLIAVGGSLVIWMFADQIGAVGRVTFLWGIALVPFIALGKLRDGALQGLGHVVQGQLSENVIRPVLLIVLIAGALIFRPAAPLGPSGAMALHCLAAVIAFLVGVLLLRRARPRKLVNEGKTHYVHRAWLASAVPLALISGMSLINQQTDIVMLGWLADAETVGIYRVASRSAMLVAFGLTAIGMVTMPYFAKFHAAGDMQRFQRLATTGARAMLALALPIALVMIVFGHTLLSLIFGDSYAAGYTALSILAVANVIHAAFGTVGPLLNMAGYERITARGIFFAAICNLVLNSILIPTYGMNGAASATAITLALWNLILWNSVRRVLHVDSSFVNVFGTRKQV